LPLIIHQFEGIFKMRLLYKYKSQCNSDQYSKQCTGWNGR
jgi:hypothetical protein